MRGYDIEVIVLSDEPAAPRYLFRRAPRWPVRSAGRYQPRWERDDTD